MGSTSGGRATKRQSTDSTTSSTSAYSVTIDDKSFHETYLAPFYDTVKNGMGGAMCSMNMVNGTYACENQDILAKYLKAELGFPGIVHADVGGQKTGINAANAGMDFSSSQYWSTSTLGVGLTNGSFTEDRLNDMVIRNLIAYYHLNQDEGYPSLASATDRVDVRGNHSLLARTYAADSIALLKNTNGALPLKNKTYVTCVRSGAQTANIPKHEGPSASLATMLLRATLAPIWRSACTPASPRHAKDTWRPWAGPRWALLRI